MDPIVEEFTITLKYQVTVDTETGEMTTKCIKRTVDKSNFEVSEAAARKTAKKTKKEESSSPQLILEDNKYYLNSAAIELMGVTPDDKLDIKYEKRGNTMIPVIGTDEAFKTKGGNKLCKNNSVACRGSKNEELAKWGNEFNLVDRGNGIFGMVNDQIVQDEEEVTDENIEIPDDIDLSLSVDSIIDDAEEVDANMFKL